jgi:hypothetical protein
MTISVVTNVPSKTTAQDDLQHGNKDSSGPGRSCGNNSAILHNRAGTISDHKTVSTTTPLLAAR